MFELEIEKYCLLEEPLKHIKINTLFARAVIEKTETGKIFADDTENPKTFYVVHPYGMSLLFGETNNKFFNKRFVEYCLNTNAARNKFEWMQAYPDSWNALLSKLFTGKLVDSSASCDPPAECIELNTRVNFTFDLERYLTFKKNNIGEEKYFIMRTDLECFNLMTGSVAPSRLWDNADDFLEYGIGFSLFSDGKLATTAYSAFITEKELEFGIETMPEYRRRGFAQYACSALIDYCISNNYEPVWACRLENTASLALAQKLGFVPGLTLPYYRLAL